MGNPTDGITAGQWGTDRFSGRTKMTCIWKYGSKPPNKNLEIIIEQMRLAHKYRNKLCEIELQRRANADQALQEHSPELLEIERKLQQAKDRIEQISTEIKRSRAENRTQVKATDEQKEETKRLKELRKEFAGRRRELRTELFADDSPLRERLSKIDNEANEKVKRARGNSGIYWGTYLTIEQAAKSFRKGAPPKFRSWTGGGKVSVQLQGGLSFETARQGIDTRLRIIADPTDPKGRRHEVWLRIGSDGRNPVWAVAQVKLHRLPPDDAQIKWAWLRAQQIGPRKEWSFSLVLEGVNGSAVDDHQRSNTGMVAIDFGWRIIEDEQGRRLRVARWYGDDGEEGELSISDEDVHRWLHCNNLRSIRDKNFEQARAWLLDWLGQNNLPKETWIIEQTKYLEKWRSSPRLAKVVGEWRHHRVEGDDDILRVMEDWRSRELHLHRYESGKRVRAERWRQDLYRNFAAKIRRKYEIVVLEDIDWRDLARSAQVTSDKVENDTARRMQRIASPGLLAETVVTPLGDKDVIRVKASFTTQRCHNCQEIERFDAEEELFHTCSKCGTRWDQDLNAAKILLAIAKGEMVEA